VSSAVLAALYAVHLLAAVVWIGGLVMLALEPERRRLLVLAQAGRSERETTRSPSCPIGLAQSWLRAIDALVHRHSHGAITGYWK
jgi:hypothetical protein